MEQCIDRWKKAYERDGIIGLTDSRKSSSSRPLQRELTPAEVIAKQKAKIKLLESQLELLMNIDPELRLIESNELVVYDTELSEFINRKIIRIQTTTKKTPLNMNEVQKIYESILTVNITDPGKRAEHMSKIKIKTVLT